MRPVSIVAIVSAVPVIAFALLAAAGLAPAWAAAAGIAVTVLSGTVFALSWARDLARLTDAVRRIETGDPAPARPGPVLLGQLDLTIARVTREIAARAARLEQDRRADTMILERLPDPIAVLRADRSVSRRNRAMDTVFGDGLDAILRHPALREALDRALEKGEPSSADLAIAAPQARELRVTAVPIDPPLRDGGRVLAVLADRTREHGIERAHTDFVANVSHELRTPLASLIGFTEPLLGPAEDDPPARRRFLTIMAEQGARMNRLIDDLLSLSRIEMTEHEAPSERVDLGTLIPGVIAAYGARPAGGARIEVEIAAGLPEIVADSGEIAQILRNLLDNAAKYGKPGSPIQLSARRPAPGEPVFPARPGVVLRVADQGPGIPKMHLPRVTERFYRVDKGRSRAAGGTGLGLAIVKHIVSRHRGQLAIDSEEGQGTTVQVWLPLNQPVPRAGESG